MTRRHAFTLIELLVVIAIIAVLMGILMPALGRVREQARQRRCASQVRQQALALTMYADEYDNKLPMPQFGGNWLWDLDVQTVNFMLRSGMTQDMFYCPSNENQIKNIDAYWTFTTDSWDGKQFTDTSSRFIVSGYVFLLDMAKGGRPEFKRERYDGIKAKPDAIERKWLRTTLEKQGAMRELVLDVVLSALEMRNDAFPNGNFRRVQGGMLGQHGLYDQTSHLKTDALPLGGNIGFLDGHVDWRHFNDMAGRYGDDRLFWW
jgi:prepilin-type N-terminal cleavage/methylation domain-containing protein/prepilin-type processing-associated H-X9-DG protein